jgi:hypothetical protein
MPTERHDTPTDGTHDEAWRRRQGAVGVAISSANDAIQAPAGPPDSDDLTDSGR